MASVFNSSNQPIAMYTQFVTDTHCSYHHLTRRGNHKIFVGMAPGVGKTYRMLDEGQRLKCQGKDVVIGFLETHNREDTIEKA